ncbi:thiol reductant ABC exporter subunit CydD [Pisciglobus halotolerans]|uniref:ATP-binding cassette, subfamily C, CydD n=1 Tax=Pisciglobus halotolerans TaxID=745365 RepID=A0A1I3CCI8_9LACT|nr:thiol reductant ABC exporter subunit CydD [Pisciglobus halotolerans]SFH72275.1 ATP-binding cassette, subfamily C, CydD [Pisciglobus halotolerans]
MVDKRLFSLSGMKKIMILLAGISFLQAFMIVFQARYLALAITGLWNGEGLTAQISRMLFFFLSFAGRHFLTMLREKMLDKFSYEKSRELRKELLDKVFSLGPKLVQKAGTGNVVTMALEGIRQFGDYVTLFLSKMMNMMVIPWIVLAYTFMLDTTSGVTMIVVFPIIILFMIILGYAAQSKADRQYATYKILSNHFVDSLRGLETLKLLGLSKSYSKNVHRVSEDYRKATMGALSIGILSTFALDFFTTLSIAIIAVFLGLRLLNGEMPLLPALTVLILAPEYFLPVREFSNDYHATLDGKNAMEAIFTILAIEVPEDTERLSADKAKWQETSELTISHLNVRHEENSPNALEDIQLHWKGYGKIGIIGMSGSGKSTFIDTFGGFLQPLEGVEIDINGVKVPHFAQRNWQKEIIYIPQKPYLFHDTLANNIRFYTPEATDEAVQQAAEKAGLASFIRELPAGLETIIGESGRMLSGGQAQRVAVARAFLDPERKILLFDEPTAHLDIETEVELKESILPLLDEHLVLFSTHRLHWMHEMDYILVLDHGRIVDAGTHEELLEKNGAYTTLMQQMRGGTTHA